MKSRVTAQQVADMAGVSRSAVSRCFGDGLVSEETRKRIMAASEALGYRPNVIARSLTGQNTGLVALLLAELENPHTDLVLKKLLVAIAEADRRALVIPETRQHDLTSSTMHALDYQVDAIVVMGGTVSDHVVDRLRALDTPVFQFGRQIEGLGGVACDNRLGGLMGGRFLVQSGRRRIAYVTKTAQTDANRRRRAGLSAALEDAGLPFMEEESEDNSFEGGYNAATRLFARSDRPDALFCFNDIIALGALQAAATFRLRVPEDVAILGFDDIPMASWPAFGLSSLRPNLDSQVGRLMAMIERVGKGSSPNREVDLVLPELVVRRTAV
ncbi:substrate-binding domain-containing protein [Azospirillum sp. A29]|uniref:LacI family DNA-binding transcriptional regulator n=1 Tax=Azospirillum sp. A29 TaxID=3160606 RepID=UPI00366C7EFF